MPVLFPSRIVLTREFNQNHEPKGTADRDGDGKGDGGRFAKRDGSGAARARGEDIPRPAGKGGYSDPPEPPPLPKGHKPPVRQPKANFEELVVKHETLAALKQISKETTDPKEIAAKHFAYLKANEPAIVRQAFQLQEFGKMAEPEFKAAMQEMAAHLGFELASKPIEDPEIADSPASHVVLGPVKKMDRIAIKASLDDGGDVRTVKDVLRGTVAVPNAEGMVSALEGIAKVAEIVSIKDSVNKPLDGGYRDIKVIMRMPKSGMLAEMQILTKPMMKAKNGIGHRLYEQMRSLVKDSPQYQQLAQQQETIYGAAWNASLAGAGAAVTSAIAAFLQSRGGA